MIQSEVSTRRDVPVRGNRQLGKLPVKVRSLRLPPQMLEEGNGRTRDNLGINATQK